MAKNNAPTLVCEFEEFMVEVWNSPGLIYEKLQDAVFAAEKVFGAKIEKQENLPDKAWARFSDGSVATIDLDHEGVGEGVTS